MAFMLVVEYKMRRALGSNRRRCCQCRAGRPRSSWQHHDWDGVAVARDRACTGRRAINNKESRWCADHRGAKRRVSVSMQTARAVARMRGLETRFGPSVMRRDGWMTVAA